MPLRPFSALRELLRLYHPFSSSKTVTLFQSRALNNSLRQSQGLSCSFASLSTYTAHGSSICSRRNNRNLSLLARASHPPFRIRTARVTFAHYSSTTSPPIQKATISTEQYHKLADTYIDKLVSVLEEIQETRQDVDCEYSAGVLTLTFPPNGTYVLNKQPPNKQIWLSSPISGPKRYDYVTKEINDGDGVGDWVYLRDNSLLSPLLESELGIVIEGDS